MPSSENRENKDKSGAVSSSANAEQPSNRSDTEQRAYRALRHRKASRGEDADASVTKTLESVQQDAENMGLFEDSYDPVRTMLLNLDSSVVTEQFLNEEADRLEDKSRVMQEALSRYVLANYNRFVQGMNHVTAIMSGLRVATIIAKNGRRLLSRADQDVKRALEVSHSQRQKGALLELLQCTLSLREVITLESRVQEQLDRGEYVEAVCTYARAHEAMDTYSLRSLNYARSLKEHLQRSLSQIVHEVERLLRQVCADFSSAEEYTRVFQAYLVLGGEVRALGDKVQESFLHLVESETHAVLREYALHSDERGAIEAASKQHAAFGEIARHIPRTLFDECFAAVLRSLQTLLASHSSMLQWHKQRMSTGVSATTEDADEEVHTQERNACADVSHGLERSRRSLWELAVMRTSTMLTHAPIPRVLDAETVESPVVLQLTQRLIKLGEAFLQSRANALRNTFIKAEERLTSSAADAAIATIRERFTTSHLWEEADESETQQVHRRLLRSVNNLSSSSFSLTDEADRYHTSGNDALDDECAFDALVSDNCLFSVHTCKHSNDTKSNSAFVEQNRVCGTPSPTGNRSQQDDALESSGNDLNDFATPLTNSMPSPSGEDLLIYSTGSETKASLDILNASAASFELLQNTIASSKAARLSIQLMQTTLEAGMVAVYQAFGGELEDFKDFEGPAQTGFSQQVSSQSSQQQLGEASSFEEPNATPRLRKVMERLQERSLQPAPAVSAVVSSGNLYGLREACKSVDGLAAAAQQLQKLRVLLRPYVPQSSDTDIEDSREELDQWFSQTADAVHDLAEHLHAMAVRQLLPLQWLPEAVANSGKYTVQEVSASPSTWVPQLQQEIDRFTASLQLGNVSEQAQNVIWEKASLRVANFVIEGFARVKKCTHGGRDQMLLDNQGVEGTLRRKVPSGAELGKAFRRIHVYVQAYHESEDALQKFAHVHPEYTYKQLTALMRHIALSRNWNKRKLRELEQAVGEAKDNTNF